MANLPFLPRFIAQYELYRRILNVPGDIVECGVGGGMSFVGWAQLHFMLEPHNASRRFIGFDTFEGFPEINEQDGTHEVGEQKFDVDLAEMEKAVKSKLTFSYEHESERVALIKGDIATTAPHYAQTHQHQLVALLFLDTDLYKPTLRALECFRPRMPTGAIVAFDEVNAAHWPGETVALREFFGPQLPRIRQFPFHSQLGYMVV